MAQQKHCVIYRETAQSHLKLVGKLYDQCQDTLVQFGTFLGSTYSVDEYVERLPSIIAMLQDYHINADVAFFLARPMFTHQINVSGGIRRNLLLVEIKRSLCLNMNLNICIYSLFFL